MKTPNEKTNRVAFNAWVEPEVKIRFAEIQLNLRRKGYRCHETTFGKLMDVLILSTNASDLLEKEFPST